MLLLIISVSSIAGFVLTIIGLVMIATQVRVHQIKIDSRGSMVFFLGNLLLLLGIIISFASDNSKVFAQLGLMVIVLNLLSAGLIGHHEQLQHRETSDASHWPWQTSLMVRIFLITIFLVIFSVLRLII